MTTPSNAIPTGAGLAEIRRSCQLTQRDLAARTRLHVNSIKRLERFDTVSAESWYALGKVGDALHLAGADIPDAWLNWRVAARRVLGDSIASPAPPAPARDMGSNQRAEIRFVPAERRLRSA